MNRPSPGELTRARTLLLLETTASDGAELPAAAGRVLEKLFANLSPLAGTVGVKAMLVRSARLAKTELGAFDVGSVESAETLETFLRSRREDVAAEMATTLFGTFFTLVATYIGERLMTQVLRRAWPKSEDAGLRETIK